VFFTAEKPAGTTNTVDTTDSSFLVVTYDGSFLTLWVNPGDTTQGPYAQTSASAFKAVPPPISLFIGIGHPDLPPQFPFNGRIQDVVFYDTVLDNTTIQDHFNAGLAG
jgi:hypothetical protein